ncbi:PREDICTED: nuclear pore complex protein Nup155 [Papilio polytes]|uniref:nuclear pore complex protein Nup155 n=1 Tax=Papilio polytes TaxID=76194 RepID=UPI000676528D|nr:PREDICTED: nuclear pore complex protein Nup155 [Papilio polytes]
MPSIINSVEGSRQSNGGNMQLECLELAGCTLDRYIIVDNSRPSFLEITGIAQQRSPTCSGLNAGDYRNLAAILNHPNLSQLKILNKVPLPPEIMEHFAHMQCHCLMGVFPEISRVWLAIDSNIYVWAFEHGSDVAYFDGLGETIVSVGLVKPKTGVFQNFVKYLLVLTTTVEIVVLGVTFSASKNDGIGEFEEIHLVPEPVFVLPTDGISMMCVKSTAEGRIFMGGKDGCLYEITYQAQLGWFGKHCKKINHSTSALSFLVPSFLNAALYDEDPIVKIEVDNSRHILYTLSEKGCIEVFDLGSDGESISRVVKLTQGKIVSCAVDIVKTLEASNFKPVIAISAVEESESDHLNLVAVTQMGARLYFSTGSGDANQSGPQRPQYLTLLHVRLPPGFTSNSSVLRPKQVHSAVYENGSLVMVCSSGGGGGEAETLWCSSFMGNVTQHQRDPNFPIQVEYSAKHNGLYIYVGRILSPIWNLKCVTISLTPDKKEFMSSRVTGEDCAYIVRKLQRVAAFLQRPLGPPHTDEHASLHALKLFITMAIEMLSLWKVLCEHQFHVIAASLPPDQQSALQAASFRELLVGGQEVACLLLGSLVAGYLRDNASVDGISQKLRQFCPTLYRQEDATCSKANELLIFAKQQKNPAEREEMLQHALKLCKDVAPNVNLPLICSKLVSVGFYSGVVELCVACATKMDPQDKAVHYYKSDQPSQDREGHLTYYRRPAALQLLDLLWKVLERAGEHLAAAEVLEGLATRPGSGATLSQRMSWLSAGVVCAAGAGGAGGAGGGGELLRRLEEAGEVARVQAAVRSAAAAKRPAPPPHLIRRLDDELLEVTQLYEEYADRYNLWECKLAIVQCSGHTDALLVESIWSNILAEAEALARALPAPDDRLASVLSKLTTLGREYLNTGHCFPLYFIVRQLEIMSCKMQADKSMVFKAVLNIGVSLEQVLDIYIKLVSVKERVWLGCGDESHVCGAAAALLEAARADVAALPAAPRRRALARCKDLHEAALSALQSRPNTKQLIDKLTVAQAYLDRME